MAQARTTPRRNRRRLLACAAGLVGGLVYLNALNNPFVYDDDRSVVVNTSLRDIGAIRAIVLHDVTRPIANLSYAIDRRLWGAGPTGFHVTSVLLHMLNVVLLFGLAWRLAHDREDGAEPERAANVSAELVACGAAALFAVHPMMTEAVGYISGRSEVLCATWFLLALLCGRRWIRDKGAAWAIGTVALWIVALATKETAAMFPFVLAAYDWLHGPVVEKRRRIVTVHLPLLATVVLVGLVRLAVLADVEYPGQVKVHWLYILMELDVVRRYVGLLVNPAGQALFHDVSSVSSVIEPRALVAMASIGTIAALGWMLRRRERLASFGLFWFLLLLVPSSALVVLDQGEPMAEHRVYLASCGMFLAAGTAIGWIGWWVSRVSSRIRWLATGALAMVLLSFAAETVARNAVWGTPVTLWQESVDRAPGHFRPRLLLGEALEDAGRRGEALVQFQAAVRLRPTEPIGYLKLGRCLADMGRFDEAAAIFRNLQALDAGSVVASSGLAVVAMLSGQPERARQHFLATIAIDPQNVPARRSLAELDETALANPAEALHLCLEIERLAPGTPGNEDCIRRNRSRLARPF